jgi:hypothetical protein
VLHAGTDGAGGARAPGDGFDVVLVSDCLFIAGPGLPAAFKRL